ncbi:MAG: phosphoglycerate kinase [Leptospiraceae bacterium]|nr:phosphoglycerate kinase [Leptospiraceae bacterium]
MSVPGIETLEVNGKKVLVRVDFNVPLDKKTGEITDTTRITASLPTLEDLLNKGASLILISHLGRPKGVRDESLSLAKVAEKLQTLLPSIKVHFCSESIGKSASEMSANLKRGEILLLENIRFYAQETSKEKPERIKFAKELTSMADAYVDDAFGACHRAHASIVECAELLPAAAGHLLKKEIQILQSLVTKPERPFVAIIGGAKVSSKIAVLENLIQKVDSILIGGAMAYTFLKSRAIDVGTSLVEKEQLSPAFQIIDKAGYYQKNFMLPEDHVIASEFSERAKIKKTSNKTIPPTFMGMDIGPKTIEKYEKVIKEAKTVLWNGPMGVFEMKPFAAGTMAMAKAMSKVKGTTVVGGGDSVAAVNLAGLGGKMTHISTGGGATLEFLEGKKLPGVEVLRQE